jgi:TRAP transporter TAXI family solute receptor
VPTAGVTDLAATPGMKIKLIDHADLVPKMNAKYGNLYSRGTIKAGSYPNQDTENKQANVWNLLVVNEKMNDQTAYNIVKTIFEHKKEWETVHKSAAEVLPESQKQENSPVPFHPGAAKYFAEKGIKLTD